PHLLLSTDTSSTHLSPLSLHDALPIFHHARHFHDVRAVHQAVGVEHHHRFVAAAPGADEVADVAGFAVLVELAAAVINAAEPVEDRKSTRLNSSHVKISYAVVCLKKKT